MKKRIVGAFSLLGIVIGGLTFAVQSSNKVKSVEAYYTPSTHYEVSDTASELASYYSSISDSDSGTTLLSKLQSLNSSKRKKTMGYSTIGTDTGGAVIYTDYDLNSTAKDSNGQTYGTKVASFYTKTAATSWNREHMWPNSHGGNNVEADILHTRPTISSENSSRGNSFYVEGKNSSSAGWDPYTAGYDAEVRGECARVILYCVVAYPSFTLSDADSHSTSNSNKDNMMGNMNTLIKWHFDYPPNVYEKNRNDGAEYLQGNRNPFVDHPEYVAKIWSSFNSTVSSLCSSNSTKYSNWVTGNYCDYGETTPVNTSGVSISASTASVTVGSTITLSATSTDSGTITWTTSNSSVASLSSSSSSSGANITITGVSAGTATITAKRTISGTEYSQTCTVTVTKVVSSLSKGSTSPTKTTYIAGESFDPTGLTITATYSDSTTGDVTSSVVWTPDPLTAGTTSVTGTFGGKSITITGLTVNAATEPEIIDSNSDLAVGDYVVLRTAAGVGVTGWNNNKDATVSETESEWKKFYVASASSSGFTLKDESANNYIASPGSSNQFIYGSAATCSTDSDGHLICNSRYLCKNGTNYRFYTSISSYLPFFIYKVQASSAKTLSSISVSTAPTKTTYTAGEYFDPTGLVITRAYSDSTSDTYTYADHTSEFTFSPSTSTALTKSNSSVTITYGGKSATQTITVNAAKTLSSISVSTAPTKTSYYVGQTFDPTGLVITRTYSDSTSDTYTYSGHTSEFSFTPSTSTALTTSNTSVTITYGGKTTTQSISVSAVTLTSIAVSTAPTKTTYVVDETFDPTGLVITRNYSNSTSDTYTYAGHTSEFTFNPSTSTFLTVEHTSVTITYGGKSCSQAITVSTSGGSGGSSEEYSGTYNVSNQGTGTGKTWSLTNYSNQTSYLLCPDSSNDTSVALIEGIFTDKTISSDVVITINSATYGSGTVPSESTFAIYNSSACTSQVTATQTGTLPSSSTYTDVIYTVAQANASNFSDDLAIKITKPGRQIRLKSIDVEFSYTEASGSSEPITSITASVSKTFYVGETISSSDITVKGNTGATVSSFTFANDGYQFTYSDAASGGASTSKTFTNAISGADCTCSLTVQVQRKAYVTPSGTSTLEHTGAEFSAAGIGSSYATGQSATVDGITFTVDGYIYSSKLSLSSSKTSAPGKVINTSPYSSGITNVTVSGASPDIQLSVDGSTWVNLSSATTSTVNYYYLKLYYSTTTQSNYVNITSFTVTLKAGETPENVANYVMYEDTNNQCTTKFDTAKGYFENLSPSGRATFMTSNDYVIATGRERLQAWAKHEGKQIVSQNGDYVITSASRISVLSMNENNSLIVVVITIASISFAGVLGLYILKRRKEQ